MYLLVVFYAHADCVDEDGDHDASAEVFTLHDRPQFDSHLHPQLKTPPLTRPLHTLFSPSLLWLLIGC